MKLFLSYVLIGLLTFGYVAATFPETRITMSGKVLQTDVVDVVSGAWLCGFAWPFYWSWAGFDFLLNK